MNGCFMMAAGGIAMDDDVRIAANVQFISENHDPDDRMAVACICRRARGGAVVLSGVTVWENRA